MSIKSVYNYNFSQSKISFSQNNTNKEAKHSNNSQKCTAVPVQKLVPAMIALAGLSTLNGCSEDFAYADMRQFKDECFDAFKNTEKSLSKVDEKTIVLNMEKDSLYKDTKDYKYRHLRVKSADHTRVFGEIVRKKDNKTLEFINVYDENDKLTSSTLKNKKTGEIFYVSYKKGFFDKVKDKDGNELTSSKYGDYLAMLLLAVGLYGAGKAASNALAPKMTNADVPFIEPPPPKQD